MSVKFQALFLLLTVTLAGCQQSTTESAAPPADAEVPQPGPAIEDPGPAPGGQWEPPVEGEISQTPEAAQTPAPDASPETPAEQPLPADTTEEASEPAESVPGDAGTSSEDSDSAAAENISEVSSEEQTDSGDRSVTLKLQSWDQTEKLISSHQGKIVVVDFWATSCLPCRREFPHLVALQKAYPERIACVSVSLDYSGRKSRPPETYRKPVLEFLNQQQATIDNVLSIDDPDELEQRLELAPIPLVWVYDREGRRVRTFDNGDLEGEEFTYKKDVVPFVQSLLSES